jgi:hypothetical protein
LKRFKKKIIEKNKETSSNSFSLPFHFQVKFLKPPQTLSPSPFHFQVNFLKDLKVFKNVLKILKELKV